MGTALKICNLPDAGNEGGRVRYHSPVLYRGMSAQISPVDITLYYPAGITKMICDHYRMATRFAFFGESGTVSNL
jgi:hypothetical protein